MTSIILQFIDLRPHGGFDMMVGDPPWFFDDFGAIGEAKAAKRHYECTSIDWIQSLPVEVFAAIDDEQAVTFHSVALCLWGAVTSSEPT